MNERKKKQFLNKIKPNQGIMTCVLGFVLGCANIAMGNFLLGCAVVLVCVPLGIINENKNKKFRHYISCIEKQRCYSLDKIGQGVGQDYSKVRSGIQKLIDNGYYENAYIDDTERCIVFPDSNVAELNIEEKVVICPNCGAKNTVLTDNSKCDYCGTPLL